MLNEEELVIDMSIEDDIIDMIIAEDESIEFAIEESTGHILPAYKGPYNVIPKIKEQVLKTENKSMTDDLTVLSIPYEEVHNVTGTTVTIGGID